MLQHVAPRGAGGRRADYDATLDALRAAGHEVDPRKEHWGAPRAFVRSPARHRFEVMAAPPPG